ncbi:MAG: TIM-barrel domain-containing protein [Bradymonadia bacterium]
MRRVTMLLGGLALVGSWGCDDDDGTSTPASDALAPDAAMADADVSMRDADVADSSVQADAEPDAEITPDAACTFEPEVLDDVEAPPIYTPRWAFSPWISKDISDRDDTFAFVAGFRERDIPVGVVVLDSPWETHYNTFVPNPSRYPDFEQMVADLRADDIRTVLWITQMINSVSLDLEVGGDRYMGPSPNLAEAELCDFLVEDGEVFTWWKGRGAGLDFFNPQARTWWHRQQDDLYDMGIAGWKLDFGEQYIEADPMMTAEGPQSLQAYSEAYYEDFYAYGASRLGTDEFVTMVRPYDKSYQFEGRFYARPEHAPVAWVGDNRRDWVGLVDALDHTFRSAQAGYVVVGSDVGGYLDFEDVGFTPGPPVPFIWETFVRWVAMGAMTPFMQLHGRANLEPWNLPERSEEALAVYRYWAWLHEAMVPFWYSLAEQAYAGGDNIIRPIGDTPEAWADDWRYQLGDALLVAPIIEPGGVRNVTLPEGARWIDWWRQDEDPLEGGQTLADYDAADPLVMPLFIREGAIIPMVVRNEVNGLGDGSSADHWTMVMFPGTELSSFTLIEDDEMPSTITLDPNGDDQRIEISRSLKPLRLRVRQEEAPGEVLLDGAPLEQVDGAGVGDLAGVASGWLYEAATRSLWVELPASEDGWSITLSPARVE